MKKILMALMGICTLALASCSSDDNGGDGIQNFWTLTKENKTLYDNDTEGLQLTVTLAFTATEDITLTPVMNADSEEAAGAFEFSQSAVTIAKGEKAATFSLRATGKKILSSSQSISVGFLEVSGLRQGDALSIAVEPRMEVEITEAQKALVQAWMDSFGFDARPFLGTLKAEASVTFNTDDMAYYNGNEETATFTSEVPVSVSDKADEENIILHMEGNALGLKAFLYQMLLDQSVNDEDYWLINPHNADLLEAVSFNADTETFNVSLDIQIDPETKAIQFTGTVVNLYGDEKEGVPFSFDFSAWNRQQALDVFIMDNGDEGKEEIEMSEAIEQGITLNPAYFLVYSDISYDEWEAGETSLYVEPSASFDDQKMTFAFPWDFMNASGYERINVTITLNQ